MLTEEFMSSVADIGILLDSASSRLISIVLPKSGPWCNTSQRGALGRLVELKQI
jgi:hypothetical protein